MKAKSALGLMLFAISGLACAQGKPASDPLPPVQAPPSIDDPGVKSDATAAAAAKASTDAQQEHRLPPEVQAAAEVAELPVVTVRQNGNETVEEYRKKGKLLFVRVLEKEGPTKFYVDDPAVIPPSLMKRLSGPSGDVQPVYFKLADWQ
jgi:hypothetical protein